MSFLSTVQQQAYGQLAACLAGARTDAEIRGGIARPLLDFLEADFYVSYVWDPAAERYGRRVAHHVEEDTLDRYDDDGYLVDVVTPCLSKHSVPRLVNQELSQNALMRTAHYNELLRPNGMYWGVNLYLRAEGHELGDLRIWRERSRPAFDEQTLFLLGCLQPALIAALQRVSQPSGIADILQPLSPRERQIANLAARGLPDKRIAQQLDIGFTTVRSHLAQVYRKLQVANRAELIRRLAAHDSAPPWLG